MQIKIIVSLLHRVTYNTGIKDTKKMSRKVFTETELGVFPKTFRRSFEGAPWDQDDILKMVSWRINAKDSNMLAGGFCPYEVITVDDSRMFRCYSN